MHLCDPPHVYPPPQCFHEAAYLADDRQDLLTAINEFLDCSVVLPPSEVMGEELLRSVALFQREMLRRRHGQEKKVAEEVSTTKDKGESALPTPTPYRGTLYTWS